MSHVLDNSQVNYEVSFLVVGGGIAGVTCAETLALCCPQEKIMLLTESSVIKTIANLQPVARYLHKFDVCERNVTEDGRHLAAPCIMTVIDQLKHIETASKHAFTMGGRCIAYRYMCICTGGRPHLIFKDNPRVLGIRDTDSVVELQNRLRHSSRIAIVGNGGIASELVHELRNIKIHWIVKDNHISSAFVDAGAAHFFRQTKTENVEDQSTSGIVKRLRFNEMPTCTAQGNSSKRGAALGPDWHRSFELAGCCDQADLTIHYKEYINDIDVTPKDSIALMLSSGERIDCDFLISATGVDPRHDFTCDQTLEFASDGGIAVNDMMHTNIQYIYAAGDACSASWPAAEHWFQMRLWTQARQMGSMAGRSMAAAFNNETIYQDFCFELFGHVTKLFGYDVILLGLYNAQGLGNDYELLLRTTPGKEYIKFVLQRGRLRGVILIGNTELAETCENLILNGIDLTPFGDDILNPDIDIEDYFD